MNEPTENMARYQSVKIVHAGRIKEIVPHGCYVEEANGSDVLREFPENMTARYQPVTGDYWVVYDDGYQAISPRAPFEAGYVCLEREREQASTVTE